LARVDLAEGCIYLDGAHSKKRQAEEGVLERGRY
jgi:hypothetical protein